MQQQGQEKSIADDLKFTLIPPPLPAGYYCIGADGFQSIAFPLTKKPSLINRIFCRWFLGFLWKDYRVNS